MHISTGAQGYGMCNPMIFEKIACFLLPVCRDEDGLPIQDNSVRL